MDRSTVSGVYEQHKNGIYRFALSILKNSQQAEDVLHDTFVKLLSGGEPREMQAWLYRVARNLCYDRLRRAKREQPDQRIPVQTGNPYAYIELIAPLPPKEQELVTLKIVGGLSHKEIGAVLGISEKAAQKRYERAIATLREMEDSYGTET